MTERQFHSRLFWIAFLATVGIMIMLGGCSAEKWCFEHFPPEVRVDTIQTTLTKWRDTTVYVQVPAERSIDEQPVIIHDTVYVEGKPVIRFATIDTARAHVQYADAKAWVSRSILELELTQKDSLLAFRFDSLTQERDHYFNLYTTTIHNTPPEVKCPWYMKLLMGLSGFVVGGGFAVLTRRR